ncbi:tape measure protein [Enterococcus innesii]|uniref:tape measure protein n=1 Tax=Enterococcus innesii TaxID=2839759 RepID=UPI0034A4FE90
MAVSSIKFKIAVDTKELSSSLKSAQSSFSNTANVAKSSGGILGSIGRGLKGIGTSALDAVSKVGKLALSVTVFKAVNSSINMITGSVSGAIKRMDTLNNSNRVFQNMGYSAEETEKMMSALNESISGLPTTLDSAVQGVQVLAATTGDVGKAEKVFSSLNNAILGFGGTADMVNNAIMQLSQLPMDGPLDAQTWNSLRNSGLTPVLQAIAKESGVSMSELKEAFGDGKLTVADFQDALIKLNEEGGGGLAALSTIAKDATAGIGTSVDIMKTAVVRGVASIIEGFDNLVKELTGKGLAEWFQDIGKQFETKLKEIAGLLGNFAEPIKTSWGILEEVFTAIQELAGTTWEALSTSAEPLGEKLGSVFGSVASFIVDNMGTIESIVSTVVEVVTGVMLGLGDAIEEAFPFFEELVNGIGGLIDKIKEMLPEGTSLTDFVRDLTPLVLKAIVGFKLLKSGVSLASGAFRTFNKAFDGINKFRQVISAAKGGERAFRTLSPVGKILATTFKVLGSAVKVLSSVFVTAFKAIGTAVMAHPIIAAIVAIIAIIVLLWTKCEWFRDGVIAVWEYLKEAWIVGVQAIGEWLSNLGQTIVEKWEEIKTATAEAWDNIKEFFAELWEGIVTKVSESVEAIGNFISEKWEAITTTTSETWNSIKEFFAELWDGIVAKVSEVVGKIVSFISEKWEAVSTATTDTWNTIKEFFVVLWDDIVAKVSEIVGKIVSFISEKWEDIKRTTSEIWEKIKTKVSDAIQGAKDKVADTVDSIKRNVSEKWNEVKNTASRVWENIKKAMTSPVEDAKKTISRTIDKIKGFFSRLQLKLPEIQLPRLPSFELKFSSKTIFGKTFSYPSGFDIGWHASGGIFTGPSVIGVGEAGDEAVVPLSNKSRMAPFAKAVADFMKEENVGSSGASGATVKQPIVLRNTIEVDGREFLFQVKEYIQEVIDEYTELQERKLGNI